MIKYLVKDNNTDGTIFYNYHSAKRHAVDLAKKIAWNLDVSFPGCYDPERVELHEYSIADDEIVDGTTIAIAKDRTDDADDPWPTIVISSESANGQQ